MADGAAAPGEGRKPRAGRAPTTPDPIEIAMEAEAEAEADAEQGAEATPARRVLLAQLDLIADQRRQMRTQAFNDRMAGLLRVLTAVVGLVVAITLGSMAWNAHNERGMVIEAFSVPPEFEARGITGKVVASKLLDRLGELQGQTISARAPSTYANNWNGDIKVEIPQTGVSIGELYRFLVQWLGQQTSIAGEVYSTPKGIVVAARIGTAPAKMHEGPVDDLDALVQAAAEDVFATSQPYRYAVYLRRNNDAAGNAANKAALQALANGGDDDDRMWALAGLSISLGDDGHYPEAIEAQTQAIAINDKFALPYNNRSAGHESLGQDEAALQDRARAVELTRRYGLRFMRPEALAYIRPGWEGYLAAMRGGYGRAANLVGEAGRVSPAYRADQVRLLALAHDVSKAEALYAGLPAAEAVDDRARAAASSDAASKKITFAFVREDWAAVLAAGEGQPAAGASPGLASDWTVFGTPLVAVALANLGRIDEARAALTQSPANCYQCMIARGQVAVAAGDPREADRQFAAAAQAGPSLPFADYEWGRALMRRGDWAGAEAHLLKAIKQGPEYADAHLALGEALMAQGDVKNAARRFADAARLTPRWGRAHLRLGQALAAQGRKAEAREKWSAAAGMDLTPTDRATVERLLRA